MSDGFSFAEVCRILGRDALTLKTWQRHFDLYVPPRGVSYSQAYLNFLEKLVTLRAFHIPLEDILELFDTEKKILRLLHVDTLTDSPTWYLDACAVGYEGRSASNRLFLSGYQLDFPVSAPAVQPTLDFGRRDPELFKAVEMGEDLRRVLQKYAALLGAIMDRIARERPVMENALAWAERFATRTVP